MKALTELDSSEDTPRGAKSESARALGAPLRLLNFLLLGGSPQLGTVSSGRPISPLHKRVRQRPEPSLFAPLNASRCLHIPSVTYPPR